MEHVQRGGSGRKSAGPGFWSMVSRVPGPEQAGGGGDALRDTQPVAAKPHLRPEGSSHPAPHSRLSVASHGS